jgi:hypothetical protein
MADTCSEVWRRGLDHEFVVMFGSVPIVRLEREILRKERRGISGSCSVDGRGIPGLSGETWGTRHFSWK